MASSLSVALLLAVAALESVASIEPSLAWNGAVTAHAFTELTVNARGTAKLSPNSLLMVETATSSPRFTTNLRIARGRDSQTRMPVIAERDGLALTYRIDDGDLQQDTTIAPVNAVAPIVLFGERAVRLFSQKSNTLAVTASDLPILVAAYEHIDAIVISDNALVSLDDAQLRALIEHVGNCGRALLLDVGRDVEQLLTQRAGCGGIAIRTSSKRDASNRQAPIDTHTELELLRDTHVQALPGQTALLHLLEPPRSDVLLMTIFLCGFLLVFLLLVTVPATRAFAAGFCVLVTGLGTALWSGGHRDSFVAWAEVDGDDRIARYSGLESLSAASRKHQTFNTPSLGRSPHWMTAENATVIWNEKSADRQIHWDTHLLQPLQVLSKGSFAIEATLRADVSNGRPTVCNLGTSASTGAYLYWDSETYAIPALAPQQRWHLDAEQNAVRTRSKALRLMRSQARSSALALLRPLSLPGNVSGNERAWLLRHEVPGNGASPCQI